MNKYDKRNDYKEWIWQRIGQTCVWDINQTAHFYLFGIDGLDFSNDVTQKVCRHWQTFTAV